MNEAAPVSGRWSAFKWVAAIVLVFAAHIGFIFAFGSRIQPVPREAPRQPSIRYVTADPDWLELTDTMLFARPHSKRFAGATWMKLPEISQPHFEWKSTAEPLPLDPAGLGEIFSRTGNDAPGLPGHFSALTQPDSDVPDLEIAALVKSRASSIQAGGALAPRRMIEPPQPGTIRAADLITNTVVQVLVDGNGFVTSQMVLPPGSGSAQADAKALELSRAIRFESGNKTAAPWTVGTLIFEWQTLPPENGTTNSPPGKH